MNEFLERRHGDARRARRRDRALPRPRVRGRGGGRRLPELLGELERLRAARGVPAAARPALPRARGRRLRDRAADARAARGARAAGARLAEGNFERSRPSSCASCSSERRGALADPAARPRVDAARARATCATATAARAHAARDPADRRAGARRGLRARCARAGRAATRPSRAASRCRGPTRRGRSSSATRSTSTWCARCSNAREARARAAPGDADRARRCALERRRPRGARARLLDADHDRAAARHELVDVVGRAASRRRSASRSRSTT